MRAGRFLRFNNQFTGVSAWRQFRNWWSLVFDPNRHVISQVSWA
jgi:hypothetical protein